MSFIKNIGVFRLYDHTHDKCCVSLGVRRFMNRLIHVWINIFSKEVFPRSEGIARLSVQFAEKYERIGGRSDRRRSKELYTASPGCLSSFKKVANYKLFIGLLDHVCLALYCS